MRKFSEAYARRTGTFFCSDPGVTSVVIKVRRPAASPALLPAPTTAPPLPLSFRPPLPKEDSAV